MRYNLMILIATLLIVGCQEEEVHTYIGKDYVQFAKGLNDKSYSFVHHGSDIERDTVWFKAFCSGSTEKEGRTFRLKQIPEYSFSYRYDESGALLDSVLVEKANQAEPGVHYVSFDDPGYQALCQVKVDSVDFRVPVIVLRDYSLKEFDKTLQFRFIENENFEPGDPNTKTAKLLISDMLVFPEAWNDSQRPEFYGKNMVFGTYGKVKHQLMIDVTGKPWDNEFIDALSYEERLFYKNMVAQELARINAEREANGEPPLMEDPANPNSVVTFP